MNCGNMDAFYGRDGLVSFGQYLLSSERNQMIRKLDSVIPLDERLKQVHHADIENWLEQKSSNLIPVDENDPNSER